MNLLFAAVTVLIFNLPFGYWRANVKKFSLQWLLAVHSPVPFVIALRLLSGLGFQLVTYPVLVGAFFSGQIAGKIIFNYRKERMIFPLTSCLICDLFRNLS
ncbi:MAG TPA: hypothetical protein VLB50_09195 [Ignavibacteriaceae bacterium]|nr:hypothetical protein [Ignavibacteriaceae bacterium]